MIYKNSIRLTMSNFYLVTRLLVFVATIFAVVFGLAYAIALPIINVLEQQLWFANLADIFNTFMQNLNLSAALSSLGTSIVSFFTILANAGAGVAVSIVGLCILGVFVGPFLFGLTDLVLTNSLYHYMSNNVKFSFLPSLFATLRDNVKLNLLNVVTKIPFRLASFAILVALTNFITLGGVLAIFTPFILLLVYIVLRSLELTLFSGWAPATVVFEKGVITGLTRGFKVNMRSPQKVYANSFYIMLTSVVINILVGACTFGVGLIITIPMTILLKNAYSMVVFYSNYGMRYYIDEFNVIVPRKLEQTDSLLALKYKI